MESYNIGVYGLGVMGASLAKNIINNGFSVALYGKSQQERDTFSHNKNMENWCIATDENEFVSKLEKPRKIFLMITSGKPVDMVIESLLPILDKDDVIIDGGNSYYKDTARRCDFLEEKGISYVGVGVSGGEKGALEGPSMMVGGDYNGWEKVQEIFNAIAGKCDDEPCCNYVGAKGSGHYVKMVHNGIEYAILQQIADIYGIMKNGLNLSQEEIIEAFKYWQDSEINSYLVDITVSVLEKNDDDGTPLVDKVLDVARMKGTGTWTLMEAVERGVYAPCISEAVFARSFSANKEARSIGAKTLSYTKREMDMPAYKEILKDALYAAMITSYAQGIELIKKASDDMGWGINLFDTVCLWKAGCIIRSELLKIISASLLFDESLNIMLTEEFGFMEDIEPCLRHTVMQANAAAVAVPTISAALTYYDMYGTEKMTVNLVQALRDCFGAHTYERVDKEGSFHTNWE